MSMATNSEIIKIFLRANICICIFFFFKATAHWVPILPKYKKLIFFSYMASSSILLFTLYDVIQR